MNELQKAEAHTILPVERLGDTLVVTPHGDLGGYSQHVFQSEFQRVRALLDDPSVKHLIIDLGGSRYFGSEMIGALVALREKVIDKGRVALAEVSQDTKAGLEIIRVEGLFEYFSTRRQAIAALATITLGQRAGRHRRSIAWAVGLIVFACAAWGVYASKVSYRIFGSRPARIYENLAREWIKYDSEHKRWAPDEAAAYRSDLLEKLAPIEQSLQRSRLIPLREDYWLEQSAVRFQALLENESEENREAFFRSMRYARTYIVARTALELRSLGPSAPDAKEDPAEFTKAAEQERREIEDSSQEADAEGAAEAAEPDEENEPPAPNAGPGDEADAA